MSRSLPGLSLILLLGFCALGASLQDSSPPDHPRLLRKPPARPPAPPRLERIELERGARLIVLEDDRDTLIDGRLIFRGGSLQESPDQAGLAELTADVLVAGGTEQTGGVELEDWLDRNAASIVASSDLDSFRIDFSCFSEDLDRTLERIGELLAIPAYPEARVERSKRRLLERIDLQSRRADDLADRALHQVIYGADSPLARPPVRRTVESLTREDLLRFHRANLGIDRLVVGMAGELQAQVQAVRMNVVLARLPRVGPLERTPGAAFLRPSRTRIFLYDRPWAHRAELRIAGPGTRRIHQDSCALELWSEAVGAKGRLGFHPDWERAGILLGTGRAANDRVGAALGELVELLRGALRELSAEELATVRERVLSAGVFEQDRPEKVLARALELEFHDYPDSYRQRRLDQLSTLTAKEISEAVRRHLDLDRLVIVAVGPARELERQLAPYGEITRIDPPVEGTALIEKILAGLGGRAAWAELRFLECEIEHSISSGTSMKLHVWQDLATPRMRVEQEIGGAKSTLVLNEEGAWMRAGDSLIELPPEQHGELVAAGWRDVHRLLRQLAISEGTCVKSEDALRFEVVDGPAQNTWIELDEAGHPSRVGYPQRGAEVILEFSGWHDFDGIFAPTEIEKPGAWKRRFVSLVPHETLGDELFDRP